MPARTHILLGVLLAVSGPAAGHAQTADTVFLQADGIRVLGVVRDVATGGPLTLAEVVFSATTPQAPMVWRSLTDSVGGFRTPRIVAGAYAVTVNALGYSTATAPITLTGYGSLELQVELSPEAIALDPIIVTAIRPSKLERSGFYERRERGLGRQMTYTEMTARGHRQIHDILRGFPGLNLRAVQGGGHAILMRGGCRPDIVLDGIRLGPVPRIEEVLATDNLEGIEVFGPATTPPQYSRSNCGTIVAWTREPGGEKGTPFSWVRAAVAAGFAALALILTGL